jgi:hypothetical protein
MINGKYSKMVMACVFMGFEAMAAHQQQPQHRRAHSADTYLSRPGLDQLKKELHEKEQELYQREASAAAAEARAKVSYWGAEKLLKQQRELMYLQQEAMHIMLWGKASKKCCS